MPHRSDAAADHSATFTQEDAVEFAGIRDTATRRRSLTTRAVLRSALSEMVGGTTAPRAWRFGRTDNGKPILTNGPDALSFSCSHSEIASIIVVSTNKEVGVDIEAAAIPADDHWLADVFTKTERAAINTLPVHERERTVARLWTLKEAYLKMLGIGIADLLEVAFDPRNDRLLSGQTSRHAAASFQTWIVNCQGQLLSVAVAIRDPKKKGAFWRRLIEECRGRSRAEFVSDDSRSPQGAAAAAPLFRGAGTAAA